jgi:pimeloyl-ACP methyl ester carboxylesterase
LWEDRYWDAEIKPDQYSYVNAALAEGYSIFTYDRLGTGASAKPDAYDIVQTNVQVEILRQLTSLARSGKLVSSSKKLGGSDRLKNYKPSKIIHVGHSLGSVITLGLITAYGPESDGVIATGFLHTDKLGGVNVGTWGFEFARENDPVKFKDRGSGYIVQATRSNTQLSFLKKGSFEPELLEYAWKIRQPNTVSEFLSIGTALGQAAPEFKAPLQVCLTTRYPGRCFHCIC